MDSNSNKPTCTKNRNSSGSIQYMAKVAEILLAVNAVITAISFTVGMAQVFQKLLWLWVIVGVVLTVGGIIFADLGAKCLNGFGEIVNSCSNTEAYLNALVQNAGIEIIQRY